MRYQYNRERLIDMLKHEGLDRDDKTAIRFALWAIAAAGGSEEPEPRGVPYWRYIRYTDDGCSVYECLNCNRTYEGRTAPGWYDPYEDADGPGEDVMSYETASGGRHYYRLREDPVYNAQFKYCPYCGIEWESAIRCDVDNERMLGERRQRIEEAMRNQPRRPPDWWWVLQRRVISMGNWGQWRDYAKMNPENVDVHRAFEVVRSHRLAATSHRARSQWRVILRCPVAMAEKYPNLDLREIH